MQFELQTHEVMEPVGQRAERKANVYSLIPVWFVCKTSEVYRDASQSVNSNQRWLFCLGQCVFSDDFWVCVCALTWKICFINEIQTSFAKRLS